LGWEKFDGDGNGDGENFYKDGLGMGLIFFTVSFSTADTADSLCFNKKLVHNGIKTLETTASNKYYTHNLHNLQYENTEYDTSATLVVHRYLDIVLGIQMLPTQTQVPSLRHTYWIA